MVLLQDFEYQEQDNLSVNIFLCLSEEQVLLKKPRLKFLLKFILYIP